MESGNGSAVVVAHDVTRRYGAGAVGDHHGRLAVPTMADRVLFLADGPIVNDIPRSSQHEILLAMEELNQS